MSPATTTGTCPILSSEVLAFAEQHGAGAYLADIIEMTRIVYPSATRFDIFLEVDAEITDEWYIVLELDAPMSSEQLVTADDRWHRRMFGLCPTSVVGLFRHSVYSRP